MAKGGAVGDDRWVADALVEVRRRVDDEVLALTMLWKWDLEREVDAAAAAQVRAVMRFGTGGQFRENPRIGPSSGGLPVHSLSVLTPAELIIFETKAKARLTGGVRFKPTRVAARWPRADVEARVGPATVASVQLWKIARRPFSFVVRGQPAEHLMTIGTSPNDDAFLAELAPSSA